MVHTHDNQEEIERSLDEARQRLRHFEERVDWGRLLLRLRSSSPAHPVLLARFVFGALAVIASLLGLVVLVVPFVSSDLARQLARIESVIPYVPADVPALPAVCGVLAGCMIVAWAMSTGAALAIGRESKLLPWEQKQHQAIVNEITRLTAVQRIRSNTPASARPRIATPAPTSMRSLSPGPLRTPSPARGGAGVGEESAAAGFGFKRTPTPVYGGERPSPQPSRLRAEDPAPPERAHGFGGTPRAAPSLPPQPAPSLSPRPGFSMPPGPRPGAVPALPPGASPTPIAGRPPAPLSATPRMGAPEMPPFDESFLDDEVEADDPEASTTRAPVADTLANSEDDGWDPTSPDLLGDPRPAPWAAHADRAPYDDSDVDGPAESSVPLLDLDGPDLDGPDDIEIEHVAEVEMVESAAIHPALVSEPSLPAIDMDIDVSDGPVVYDPAAVRESPAQPQQVRRPDSPSDDSTVRGHIVVPEAKHAALIDLPDSGAVREEADDEPPEAITEGETVDSIAQQGILARARQGSWESRATPYGSAGRIRPTSPPPLKQPRSTRGGTPLGAPPQETGRRAAPPPAAPAAPVRTARDEAARKLAALSRLEPITTTEPDDEFEEDEVTVLGNGVASGEDAEERWLNLIVAKAQTLSRHLPAQAQMAFSQEPHLPFTLVIARATPTVAVRAMMSFVEFLANIPTPPRARIELVQVSHLDRSFHRNVQAALEPHFDRNVVVEPTAGRVDIQFTDPDPRWGRHPRLPA